MTQEKAKEKYDELFATEADKAAAFDEIARHFTSQISQPCPSLILKRYCFPSIWSRF